MQKSMNTYPVCIGWTISFIALIQESQSIQGSFGVVGKSEAISLHAIRKARILLEYSAFDTYLL